ncbi:jg14684 [Pararge aegeria aegeria]|uniref:Jg14684 protein n=1 Tax=Pararge aegeria aegeria TaxID=348720 RepID=A0A8S4RAC4_9NEOP|nr:jg14684 [Pararge aegeria aegeria]
MTTVLKSLFIMISLSISRSDYVLYEVKAYNSHERALLYALQLRVPLITFLNGVSNEAAIPMDVIVNREISHMFEGSLRALDIQWNRVSQITSNDINQKLNTVSPNNISDSFYNWDDILNWIETKKHKKYKKIVVAKTYEKRDIFFLKLEIHRKNPTVFIVGGEDGMDWISSAVILNLLNDLLEGINELKSLLNHFNFYLLPILNPDGFAYSKSQVCEL